MRLEEENKVEQTQSAEENKPVSALDAINASFAAQRNEMGGNKGKAKPASAEKEKRPAEGKKKSSGKEDLKWNLVTAFLILVIIVVAAVIVVTLYQSSRAEGQTGTEPPQTAESQQTGNTEQSNQETEAQTDKNSETETSKETESTEGEEEDINQTESQTQGIVPQEYISILTEDEQKEWKEKQKDSSRVFIQLNQRVEITDMENVYLRLINPPYSVFTIQVKIYPESDPMSVLYESDRVAPGTVLEYVPFSGTLDAGSHPAKVEYTVYDEDGNKLGTHVVDITLEVNAE